MRAPAHLLPAGLALLSACAAPNAEAPPVVQAERPLAVTAGLEGVMGSTARTLIATFGRPAAELREGPARKLQFLGPACVLDAYLYPPRGGRGEPVVTHVDARLPDGREMDRSSCVAALSRRREAR